MWNTMWKTCEKCPIFTLFSHVFHMFFTHFSHAFPTHISHACEILHSEICVKRVWSDVIPFTHIFTYTSHGVSHRLSHVNPYLNSHIFSYTSHGVSHRLSHVLPHWMAKHLVIHTLFHIHFTSSHGVSHELSHANPQWSEIMNGYGISLPFERKQTNYATDNKNKTF